MAVARNFRNRQNLGGYERTLIGKVRACCLGWPLTHAYGHVEYKEAAMLRVLSGISTMHTNVLTDVRLAADAGYDGAELLASKVVRFLDAGYRAEDLAAALTSSGLTATCINALRDVERDDEIARRALFDETRRLCEVAVAIHCPVIQLVAFDALAGRPEEEILRLTASNVAAIADIGRAYDIAFQVEPIAWSPIRTLGQWLRLIENVDRPNVGLVIDFWHSWAAGDTPEAVARLEPSQDPRRPCL